MTEFKIGQIWKFDAPRLAGGWRVHIIYPCRWYHQEYRVYLKHVKFDGYVIDVLSRNLENPSDMQLVEDAP